MAAPDINSLRRERVEILFAVHGVPATYQPLDADAVTTRVKIERDVDRFETDGGQLILAERRTLIRVRNDHVTESKRGDTIVTDDGESFNVDEIAADNGFVRILAVRPGESS